MKTIEQAFEEANERLGISLVAELQKKAGEVISARPSSNFGSKRTGKIFDIRYKLLNGEIEISFPKHAQYLEYGTGIYGPKKQRIYPKTKKALAFGKDLGGGKKEFVFRSVAGMRPSPFIRPTFHQKFIDLLIDALNESFKDLKL